MTLKRAIYLAKAWANGEVCTLRKEEMAEYHKMAAWALLSQEAKVKACLNRNDIPYDHLWEVDQAEKDGRLVMLPCKRGDRLYRKGRDGTQYIAKEFCVSSEYVDEDGSVCIFASPVFNGQECTSYECFDADEIGKTVFLSREEAEAALEKEEKQ